MNETTRDGTETRKIGQPNPLPHESVAHGDHEHILHCFIQSFVDRKRLSGRESEVFRSFVLHGTPSKQIAFDLGVAYPTVKLYWTRICHKLACETPVEALVLFVHDCILHSPPSGFAPHWSVVAAGTKTMQSMAGSGERSALNAG